MSISEDKLGAIAFIFERDNGNVPGDYEARIIEESGLSDVPSESLANEIIESLYQHTAASDSYRVSAYWALSKRHDTNLIPHFRRWLESELSKDRKSAVFQLLIALGNLGEPVFGEDRNGSYSSEELELNVRDAKSYLESYVSSHSN